MINKRATAQEQAQSDDQLLDPLLRQLDDDISARVQNVARREAALREAQEKVSSLRQRLDAVEARCMTRDQEQAQRIAAHRAAGDSATLAGDDAKASMEFGKAAELEAASKSVDAEARTDEMQSSSLQSALNAAIAEQDRAESDRDLERRDLVDAQKDRTLALADLQAEAYLDALARIEKLPYNAFFNFSVPLGLSKAFRVARGGNSGASFDWINGPRLEARIQQYRDSKGSDRV